MMAGWSTLTVREQAQSDRPGRNKKNFRTFKELTLSVKMSLKASKYLAAFAERM